ncbi:MAG: right-handed parallel beta-helix repeat-containing protein [Pseudolabrys sp.]|nr:right-handed parallel beta-helix repeat-containing protein [Pseudolabrys sp.]
MRTFYLVIFSAAFSAAVAMSWPASGPKALDAATPILQPGHYEITRDITGSFQIDADDVSLDLGGYTIICAADTPGISAPERKRVIVRNGTITDCRIAVNAPYGENITIDHIKIVDTTFMAVNLSCGSHNNVRHVHIENVTGDPEENYGVGINGLGSYSTIEDSIILNVNHPEPGHEGVAIIVSDGETAVTIRRTTLLNRLSKNNIGLWVAENSSVVIDGGYIKGFERPLEGPGKVEYVQPCKSFYIGALHLAGCR